MPQQDEGYRMHEEDSLFQQITSIEKLHSTWVLLRQAGDAAYKLRYRELRSMGISPGQASVLFLLKHQKELLTPSQIAKILFKEKHSIGELLDRMEIAGLVESVRDRKDGRLRKIRITQKGEELYHSTNKDSRIENVMSSIPQGNIDELRSYLRTIHRAALKELDDFARNGQYNA